MNGRQKKQNKSYSVQLNYNLTKRTQHTQISAMTVYKIASVAICYNFIRRDLSWNWISNLVVLLACKLAICIWIESQIESAVCSTHSLAVTIYTQPIQFVKAYCTLWCTMVWELHVVLVDLQQLKVSAWQWGRFEKFWIRLSVQTIWFQIQSRSFAESLFMNFRHDCVESRQFHCG